MAVDRNSKEFKDKVNQMKKIKYTVLGICFLAIIIAIIIQM